MTPRTRSTRYQQRFLTKSPALLLRKSDWRML